MIRKSSFINPTILSEKDNVSYFIYLLSDKNVGLITFTSSSLSLY